MIQKALSGIAKNSGKLLSAAVTAAVLCILHWIDKYFTKKKYFKKGEEAERKRWEEQQKEWEKKVKDIQTKADISNKEKLRELNQLRRDFEDYIRKNKNK